MLWVEPVKHIVQWMPHHGLRSIGLVLPTLFLYGVCWPIAAMRTAAELVRTMPTVRHFRQLPASLRLRSMRRGWVLRLWWQRIRLNQTRLLYLWQDKFRTPRWARRIHCDGAERLDRLVASGRPVILEALHCGPLPILFHWLRSRGLRAAALVARDPYQPGSYHRHLVRLSERVNGLEGVPRVFEPRQIYEMHEFLKSGGVLLVAMDGGGSTPRVVPHDDFTVKMFPGTFKLAAMSGAAVVPCVICSGPLFSFTVHLGEPVPDELVADKRHYDAACRHILEQLIPRIRTMPEQLSYELMCRIKPRSDAVESPASPQ